MILNAPVQKIDLGFGRVGVPRRTAQRMRDIIRKSSANLYVRKWAEKIVQDVVDRDEDGEVEAIYDFLQRKTRYARDPRGTEFIQTPPFVLKHIELGMVPSLDCDDYTVTGLSLLRSLGYPTIIRVTGYRDDGRFTHVYGMVKVDGRWVCFDPVRKDQFLGWEAPGKQRQIDLEV